MTNAARNGNGNGNGNGQRTDSILYNVFTGMGTANSKAEYTKVGYATWLEQPQLDELACDVFLGRICSAKPDAATDKWCRLSFKTNVADDVAQKFEDYRDKIGGESDDEELITDRELFGEACYLANIYRGSAIILDVDDGQPPDQPINAKRIRTIASAQVLDSFKIYPDLSNSLSPKTATHYEIIVPRYGGERLVKMFDPSRFKRNKQGFSYRVHRSRILRFPGVRVPPNMQLYNRGWDRSLLEQLFEIFRDWKTAYSDVGGILNDYSLFVYMLSGLSEMKTEQDSRDLRRRFQEFKMSISAMGGAAIDKDNESISFAERQFGGIPDVMDRFRDMLIGASDVPHTILFGESPSGLGATGESEELTWQKTVSQYQTRVILPRLKRLYRLIFQAQDGPTNGEDIPGGYDIEFLPLNEEPVETKIANQSTVVTTLSSAISAGFLLADEARLTFTKGNGIQLTLDDDLWQQQKQQQDQSFDFGGFGGGDDTGNGNGAAPPEDAAPEEAKQDSLVHFDRGEKFSDKALHSQAYNEAKAKFSVFPSAYASLWLSKRYRELYKKKHGSVSGAFTSRSDRLDDTRQWLKQKWVRISSSGEILGPCGDRSEGEGKPKCVPAARARAMSKDDRAKIVRRKRRSDPDVERSGSPIRVSSDPS